MKYLMDTTGLVWLGTKDRRLGRLAAKTIAVAGAMGGLCISAISLWEIALKFRIGRLALPLPPEEVTQRIKEQIGFRWIALDAGDALLAAELPDFDHHKDPADRMIVAQAVRRRMCLLTSDSTLLDYAETGHIQVEDLRA